MSDITSEEPLLNGEFDDELPSEKHKRLSVGGPRQLFRRSIALYLISPLVIFSVILNIGFIFSKVPLDNGETQLWRSPYTGLSYDQPIVYTFESEFWGQNQTLSDELWDGIDINPIAVALSDEWVEDHKLEPSLRFPWDDNKGLYFIKVFHSLHCLKLIRKAYVDFERGNERLITSHHIHHCLDAMRQDVMCKADDTPMPSWKPKHSVGDGQVMQCKDFSKLVAWTQDPERQACYDQLDDYRTVANSLERHAFCPKDSQYYPVMKAYFDRHGHKEPFVN